MRSRSAADARPVRTLLNSCLVDSIVLSMRRFASCKASSITVTARSLALPLLRSVRIVVAGRLPHRRVRGVAARSNDRTDRLAPHDAADVGLVVDVEDADRHVVLH